MKTMLSFDAVHMIRSGSDTIFRICSYAMLRLVPLVDLLVLKRKSTRHTSNKREETGGSHATGTMREKRMGWNGWMKRMGLG